MAVVYFHPTCASSRKLIKGLVERGYSGRVRFVDLTKPVKLVWSVPWVEFKGKPTATDPVSVEEVVEILEGRARPPKHVLSAFVRTLIHSMYASSLAYLHRSLEPVMDPEFLSAATRHPLGGAPPEEVKRVVLSREEEVLKRYEGDLEYTLAVGYVRYLYWSGGREPEERELALWLLTHASFGRVGLPWDPSEVRERGLPSFSRL